MREQQRTQKKEQAAQSRQMSAAEAEQMKREIRASTQGS